MRDGQSIMGFDAGGSHLEFMPVAVPKMLPSVSIIIPVHNAAGSIEACVRSVEQATYAGLREIIVVDDASTDSTADVVATLPCRVLSRKDNAGPAAARNDGAAWAVGDILLFVDADTEMLSHTIEEAVRVMDEEQVGAVTGIYEPEPINEGFWPRYYAYFKYQGLTGGQVKRLKAFGAHCGAVRRELFFAAGGYRDIPWGMDIENEEFGVRLRQHTEIAISPRVRVRHHFPDFAKLLFIFLSRVYWFVLFRHFARQKETVLVTDQLGKATASCPASILAAWCAAVVSSDAASLAFGLISFFLLANFVRGYAGFWRLCFRRQGLLFSVAAALASLVFSFVVTVSALAGFAGIVWHNLLRRPPAFIDAFPEVAPC